MRPVTIYLVLITCAAALSVRDAWADSPSTQPIAVHLSSPQDYQVFQRDSDNQGKVVVAGTVDEPAPLEYQFSGDTRLSPAFGDWKPLRIDPTSHAFSVTRVLPAGGWYVLKVRPSGAPRGAPGDLIVPNVGVGEVFVVAGQSNSTNFGSEKQKVRTGLVSTFDGAAWRIADDPQPGVQDGSTGGSFIPAFGDALSSALKVPIAVASVGCGATSVRQWLPKNDPIKVHPTLDAFVKELGKGKWACDGTLFDGLTRRMSQLGPNGFRAVLWHQGESDVGQARAGYPADRQITATEYAELMKRLIGASRKQAGWDMPWLVAQATYHSPADPADEPFRAAQKSLWDGKTIFEGPDTDALTESYRAGVHFNATGLQVHGRLWAEKVIADLRQQMPAMEPAPF